MKRFFFSSLPIHIIFLVTSLIPNSGLAIRIRGYMLRPFFKKCGRGLKVASGVVINHPERIELGEDVYFAHNVWINGTGGLKLGSNIRIGPMCVVVTSKHVVKGGVVEKSSIQEPVIIQSGVWLASHVTVAHGVEIGAGTIIGANSVVTKSLPPNVLAAGLPAKVIKSI